eukprot:1923306-Prymnesium_polylepis.1
MRVMTKVRGTRVKPPRAASQPRGGGRAAPMLWLSAVISAAASDDVVQVSINRADRPMHEWNADGIAAFERGD